MREIRTYGLEGGAAQPNAPSLPLSRACALKRCIASPQRPHGALRSSRGTARGPLALQDLWFRDSVCRGSDGHRWGARRAGRFARRVPPNIDVGSGESTIPQRGSRGQHHRGALHGSQSALELYFRTRTMRSMLRPMPERFVRAKLCLPLARLNVAGSPIAVRN